MVWVHIDGGGNLRFEQDTTGRDDWSTVCTAPCDQKLPTAYRYRVTGNGIKESGPLRLSEVENIEFSLRAPPPGSETIRVHDASKTWFVIGVIAVPVGAVAAYFGLEFAAGGVIASGLASTDGGTSRPTNTLEASGWTMFGLGAVVAVGGLILTIANWETSVDQQLYSPTPGLLQSNTWMRMSPLWKEVPLEGKAMPPAMIAPVLSASF
jgi:hypothetical protein